jgi:MFS transporter, NNP family, nitrate/nitrite transporter
VTHWSIVVTTVATVAVGFVIKYANESEAPEDMFVPFLLLFLLMFITTGMGNGSTFRMVPIIFEKRHAGPVLGKFTQLNILCENSKIIY